MKKSLLLAVLLTGLSGVSFANGSSADATPNVLRVDVADVMKGNNPGYEPKTHGNFELLEGKTMIYDKRVLKSSDGKFDAGASIAGPFTYGLKNFPVDQLMTLLEGQIELTPKGGKAHLFGPGQTFVIPRGYEGIFRVVSPLKVNTVHYAATANNPDFTPVLIDPAVLKDATAQDAESSENFKILKGKPKTNTEIVYKSADGAFEVGVSSLGKVKLKLKDWGYQYMTLLAGEVKVTGKSGKTQRFKAGDSLVIPKGFSGTWENVSPIKMYNVYYTPTAPATPAAK